MSKGALTAPGGKAAGSELTPFQRANRTAEKALDRADELLRVWEPVDGGEACATAVRDVVLALKSGEAQGVVDVLAQPAPVVDFGFMIAELIASWPPREKADLSIFTRNMATDVQRLQPSRAALLLAARNLRTVHTFLPSIAEVVQAVQEAKETIASRRVLLARLPRRVQEVRDALDGPAKDGPTSAP